MNAPLKIPASTYVTLRQPAPPYDVEGWKGVAERYGKTVSCVRAWDRKWRDTFPMPVHRTGGIRTNSDLLDEWAAIVGIIPPVSARRPPNGEAFLAALADVGALWKKFPVLIPSRYRAKNPWVDELYPT